MRVIAVVALAVPMRTDLHWELKHRTHISAALNQVIIYEWLSGAWGLNSGWCQEYPSSSIPSSEAVACCECSSGGAIA
jgi:hypothetical protein